MHCSHNIRIGRDGHTGNSVRFITFMIWLASPDFWKVVLDCCRAKMKASCTGPLVTKLMLPLYLNVLQVEARHCEFQSLGDPQAVNRVIFIIIRFITIAL